MGEDNARRAAKRKSCEVLCDLGCVNLVDWEEPHLPIWDSAASRRLGEFQHLRDAPRSLPELMQWLRSVSEFEESSAMECPSIKSVFDLAGPSWDGVWTPQAILSFQAAANASGIMHPTMEVRKALHSAAPSRNFSPARISRRISLNSRSDSVVRTNCDAVKRAHMNPTPSSALFVVPNLIPLVILSDSDDASVDEGRDDECDSLALSNPVKDDATSPFSAG